MAGTASMGFDAVSPLGGLRARVTERFRLWRERRRWIAGMANAAAAGRLDGVLHDVGITRADLDALADGPVDAGRPFERLAELERVDLRKVSPAVLREAEWVCTRCACREDCGRWLRTGVWDHAGDSRCPNAALLWQ